MEMGVSTLLLVLDMYANLISIVVGAQYLPYRYHSLVGWAPITTCGRAPRVHYLDCTKLESCNYDIWDLIVTSATYTTTSLLFSLFIQTCLVAQESVTLSKCRTLGNMVFWLQMLYYRGFSRNWPISI